MADWGDAIVSRHMDGRVSVLRADPVIGISLALLAQDSVNLPVDDTGCILLAGDRRYRYRPIRLAPLPNEATGQPRVLVCERVPDA